MNPGDKSPKPETAGEKPQTTTGSVKERLAKLDDAIGRVIARTAIGVLTYGRGKVQAYNEKLNLDELTPDLLRKINKLFGVYKTSGDLRMDELTDRDKNLLLDLIDDKKTSPRVPDANPTFKDIYLEVVGRRAQKGKVGVSAVESTSVITQDDIDVLFNAPEFIELGDERIVLEDFTTDEINRLTVMLKAKKEGTLKEDALKELDAIYETVKRRVMGTASAPEMETTEVAWTLEDEQVLQEILGIMEALTKKIEDAAAKSLEISRQLEKIEKTPTVVTTTTPVKETPPEIKSGASPESLELQFFTTDLIAKEIKKMLEASDKIGAIENISVKGNKEEIKIDIKVLARPANSEVDVQAILESKKGVIRVKNYTINANLILRAMIKFEIAPQLNEVSEKLKEHIEKETGKKVEKMEIEKGQLKVTFKK